MSTMTVGLGHWHHAARRSPPLGVDRVNSENQSRDLVSPHLCLLRLYLILQCLAAGLPINLIGQTTRLVKALILFLRVLDQGQAVSLLLLSFRTLRLHRIVKNQAQFHSLLLMMPLLIVWRMSCGVYRLQPRCQAFLALIRRPQECPVNL